MRLSATLVVLFLIAANYQVAANPQVTTILTNKNQQFAYQNPQWFKDGKAQGITISVDDSKHFQTIKGFGAALTESSAYLIKNMDSTTYWNTLNKLFNTNSGIGVSYIRLPISASDFSLGDYSYDWMPSGQSDPNMDHFTIERDMKYVIPVLKDIKKVNPNVKIMMSPWSAPGWMKTTGNIKGSINGKQARLIKNYYPALAKLFVKAIQAYANQGLQIDSMTIQNEPMTAPAGYPGMFMDQYEQTDFLNNHLAPAFLNNGIKTKVFVFDHNWDMANYPVYVFQHLNDKAKQVVGGAALHCYGGDVSAQTWIHNQFPNYSIYMTECSGGGWSTDWNSNLVNDMKRLFIGSSNNWGEVSMKWNLVLDQNDGPKNGGCQNCWGLLTYNTNTKQISERLDFYTVGTFSKYVPSGSIRIQVNSNNGDLLATGFLNPDGTRTVIVMNQSWNNHQINLSWQGKYIQSNVNAQTLAVFRWKP